jgi:endonuclease/exonuclease/phosphatase family metal-dependent hydrolase
MRLSIYLLITFIAHVAALQIATFNIRVNVDGPPNDWASRKSRIAKVLETNNIDIAGLQEVKWETLNDLMTVLPGWCYNDFSGVDNVIIYKCGIAVIDHGNWALSDDPAFGSNTWGLAYARTMTMGKFKTSAGVVYVYNTHIDIIAEKQGKQADFIIQKIKESYKSDGRIFIMGDFNADPGSEFVKKMEGFTFIDTWNRDGNGGEPGTFGGDFTKPSGPKIDFVLATECTNVVEAKIVRQQVDGHWPSDHAMVYVSV